MQNVGQQYTQGGAVSSHQNHQLYLGQPEHLQNPGSTTSSLRQFRKKDVEKQSSIDAGVPESHVARVAPHQHYPPQVRPEECGRYQSQFHDYSGLPQPVKYSEISNAHSHLTPSVIQKAKGKDFMDMCNVQQHPQVKQGYPDHQGSQQYGQEASVHGHGQYLHKEQQVYPGYKPESQYYPKDQYQHPMASKYTAPPAPIRKYPTESDFFSKVRRINPSLARSIMNEHHHMQEQPAITYPNNVDQSRMYSTQNPQRFINYPAAIAGPNHPYPHGYVPQAYSNYSACSYARPSQMAPRFPSVNRHERSLSPRRTYAENVINYPALPQKISPNYSQYNAPEYAQHYQHRRTALASQEYYQQHCRPNQYHQHQIPAQEIQENQVTVSDNIKNYLENWDENTASEITQMENNTRLKDALRLKDEQSPEAVYMTINASELQYLGESGIPFVTSENGIPIVTSENGQYIIRSDVELDNSAMVRLIDKNSQIEPNDINSNKVVNVQILDPTKADCMLVAKSQLQTQDQTEDTKVIVHENTVIRHSEQAEQVQEDQTKMELPISNETVDEHQKVLEKELLDDLYKECKKETADKNCSPINLSELEKLDESLEQIDTGNKHMPIIDFMSEEKDKIVEAQENVNLLESNQENLTETLKKEDIAIKKENNVNNLTEVTKTSEKAKSNDKNQNLSLVNESSIGKKECPTHSTKVDDPLIFTLNKAELIPEAPVKQPKNTELVDTSASKEVYQSNQPIKAFAEINIPNHAIPTTKRTKRIFSVDDIINNIGNNFNKAKVKKDVSDRRLSLQLTKEFLEKEVDHSFIYDLKLEVSRRVNTKKECNQDKESTQNFIEECHKDTVTNENTLQDMPDENFKVNLINVQSKEKYVEKNKNYTTTKDKNVKDELKETNNFSKKKKNFVDQNEEKPIGDENIQYKNQCKDVLPLKVTEPIDVQRNLKCPKKIQDYTLNTPLGEQSKTMETTNFIDALPRESELNINNLQTNPELREEMTGSKNAESHDIPTKAVELTNEAPVSSIILSCGSNITKEDITLPTTIASNSPEHDVQYRNAIRIEENSVLLEIAGELVEINVTTVNGKKVITVFPLSDSTVLDCNDNYETEQRTGSVNLEKTDIVDTVEETTTATTSSTLVPHSDILETPEEVIIGMELNLVEEIQSDLEKPLLSTKAAKKVYENDLQIPSITTSEDIRDNISCGTYDNDKVSSSKQQVKETSQEKEIKKKTVDSSELNAKENFTEIKDILNEKKHDQHLKVVEDEEFVPFKDLLKARKLKIMKKNNENKADSTNKEEEKHTTKRKTTEQTTEIIKDTTKIKVDLEKNKKNQNKEDAKINKKSIKVKSLKEKIKIKLEEFKNDLKNNTYKFNPEPRKAQTKDTDIFKKITFEDTLKGIDQTNVLTNENPLEKTVKKYREDPRNKLTTESSTKKKLSLAEYNSRKRHLHSSEDVVTKIKQKKNSPEIIPKFENKVIMDVKSEITKNIVNNEEMREENKMILTLKEKTVTNKEISEIKEHIVVDKGKIIVEEKFGIETEKLDLELKKLYTENENVIENKEKSVTFKEKCKLPRTKSLEDLKVKPKKKGTVERKLSLGETVPSLVTKNFDWEETQSPKSVQQLKEPVDKQVEEFKELVRAPQSNKKLLLDLDELKPKTSVTKDESLQNYKDQVESKLSSIKIQVPRMQSKSDTNSLVRRFLKNEKITNEEMERIKKIISFKRLMVHFNGMKSPERNKSTCSSDTLSADSPSTPTSYEIRRESSREDMKLHLKKVPDKRRKPRFRNLYSESTSESDSDRGNVAKTGDYSVVQLNSLATGAGVPKLIIKRKAELPVVPVVRLERINMELFINKKRKYY